MYFCLLELLLNASFFYSGAGRTLNLEPWTSDQSVAGWTLRQSLELKYTEAPLGAAKSNWRHPARCQVNYPQTGVQKISFSFLHSRLLMHLWHGCTGFDSHSLPTQDEHFDITLCSCLIVFCHNPISWDTITSTIAETLDRNTSAKLMFLLILMIIKVPHCGQHKPPQSTTLCPVFKRW